MDVGCSIYALISCFSWSNFYLDGGVHWQDRGASQVSGFQFLTEDGLAAASAVEWRITHKPDNPYGWIGLGYLIKPSHNIELNIRLGAHRSSFENGDDRGYNYAGVDFRWFLLRGRN